MSVLYYDKRSLSLLFPKREERSHKGVYGRVFMVCGSYSATGLSMSGAASLASRAAYRTGSGIVQICTPVENYAPISACVPEAIFNLYNTASPDIESILRDMSLCDTALIGCGIGRDRVSREILLAVLREFGGRIILDADALNILASAPQLWHYVPHGRVIITPHPGEMSALCGLSVSEILDDTARVASDLARQHGIVCVLKDHNTVTSDGEKVYINNSGNAGMATAGSGDVLSGIISSLVSQKRNCELDLCDIAAAGVYLHGIAGDAAQRRLGEYSLTASDIINCIPEALTNL